MTDTSVYTSLVHPRTGTLIHPIFHRFSRWRGATEGFFAYDWLGLRTDPKFQSGIRPTPKSEQFSANWPPPGEQYFEWVVLLESVLRAERSFTMIELGAGRGSWLVRAKLALEQHHSIPICLVGVEGSPTRFGWMLEHFKHNGLDPADHTLLEGVVTRADGYAYFVDSDNSATGYGDKVIGLETDLATAQKAWGVKTEPVDSTDRTPTKQEGRGCIKIRSYSLPTLLQPYTTIDLIHMDIQGEEYNVLSDAIADVAEKVKVVLVGTHSEQIHSDIRALFQAHAWIPRYDYGYKAFWSTDWGDIQFRDGFQAWHNPKFFSRQGP